jgi:hypothetical protein
MNQIDLIGGLPSAKIPLGGLLVKRTVLTVSCSFLDLSTKTTHIASKVRAVDPNPVNPYGTVYTLAAIANSAGGTLTLTGYNYVFGFTDGVTAVSQFETAIAASANLRIMKTAANPFISQPWVFGVDEFAATPLSYNVPRFAFGPTTNAFRLFMWGGGGAGGTAGDGNSAVVGAGSGGQAGGYLESGLVAVSPNTVALPYVVGLGGSYVLFPSDGAIASAGGATTFTVNGIVYTASGGAGGTCMSKTAGPATVATAGTAAGSGGIVNTAGMIGDPGINVSVAMGSGGTGGSSLVGGGGAAALINAASTQANGGAGTGFASGGGGGAFCNPSDTAGLGGNGADGLIIIEEYQ